MNGIKKIINLIVVATFSGPLYTRNSIQWMLLGIKTPINDDPPSVQFFRITSPKP